MNFKNKKQQAAVMMRIKSNAAAIFSHKVNSSIRPDATWTPAQDSYYDTLKVLRGKKLKVDRVYGKRVVLRYTPAIQKKLKVDKNIVSIDLERDLVETEDEKRNRELHTYTVNVIGNSPDPDAKKKVAEIRRKIDSGEITSMEQIMRYG